MQCLVITSEHRLGDREAWSEQRQHTILANRFGDRNAVKKLLLGFFDLAEKKPALGRIEMRPRTAFARVQPLCNLDLATCILETGREVSSVNTIFPEKLIARSLREENVVLLTKLDRAPGPAILFVVETVVLITAGRVRVDLRDHRRGKSADTVAVCC